MSSIDQDQNEPILGGDPKKRTLKSVLATQKQSKGARLSPFIALYKRTITLNPAIVMLGGSKTKSHGSASTGAFMKATLTSAVSKLRSSITDTAKTQRNPSNDDVGT